MSGIIVGAMIAKLTASLRAAPATLPALAALALFLVWATDSAGYPVTHWAPGGLVVLALLGLTLVLVRGRVAEVRRPVKIALVALAAYTALSFLSILWAAVPGDAWEGANRTLLYLMVFALFACWPQRGVSAALLLGTWVLGMIALAAFAALHVDVAGVHALQTLLPGGRLVYPSGYPNANAAQFLMAFWPALLLARSERLPWALRGVFAGGAVLLAEVALMSQSRGSLYATPVMLILVFALIPARTRTFALLVPVAAGIAAAAPAVLHVGDHLAGGSVVASTVHTAVAVTFVAAAIVGLLVALGSAIEARGSFSEASLARIRRAVAAVAIAALVAVLAGGLVAAGNPVTRVSSAWHSFKGGYGANSSTGNRLVSGLGSNRYDFYRVALDQFVAHPIAGIGADNYQQQYLLHGRSDETPRYPHSVELRALSETGLLGALLLLTAIGAALAGTAAALRRSDPLARSVAAAALAGFAYWLVHGSIDWFWEFAGLGAPAFALLGLACALAPTARPALAHGRATPRGPGARRMLGAFALLVGLAIAASLTAPWLSQLEVQDAAHIWTRAPRTAYSRLNEAADLNPLSDTPYLVAGSIALRYGELNRADREFTLALGRTPDDAYATLERGAIASYKGERAAALGLLQRAVHLDPRDALASQSLALARRGGRVDIVALNRAILLKAQQFA
jgi:tetratricopeptide (TPR) repeat protein